MAFHVSLKNLYLSVFVVLLCVMWRSNCDGHVGNKNVYPRGCDGLVFYALSIDYGLLTFILFVHERRSLNKKFFDGLPYACHIVSETFEICI